MSILTAKFMPDKQEEPAKMMYTPVQQMAPQQPPPASNPAPAAAHH